MTSKWLVVIGLALSACASDDGGGGAGAGNDTLPKRGEVSTDPTIVSATAYCSTGGDGGSASDSYIEVKVAGSDPMGQPNLGTCAATIDSVTDQDSFGSSSSCYLYIKSACQVGQVHTVGLTISNDTGGVTTASVKLTIAPS